MRRLFLAVAVVSLAFALTPVSALAAGQLSPAAKPVTHDMSHPVKANYPCPGMSHSGVGPSPEFNCDATVTQGKSPQGIVPNANSPAGYCVNNVAYKQSYPTGGATRWSASGAGKAGAYVDSWVEYYWCPLKSGTGLPWSSINWAYGVAFPSTSQCVFIYVGYGSTWANAWYGSEYHPFPSTPSFAGAALTTSGGGAVMDGEAYHVVSGHTICPGPTGYIWDYSQPADGSQVYQPHMYGNNADNPNTQYWSDANWGWSVYR
jgi:hypothetical protein